MYVHFSTFLRDILWSSKNTNITGLKKLKSTTDHTDYLYIHLKTFDIDLKTF